MNKQNISQQVRRYGVVGSPIKQSLSPWLHAHFARRTQKKIVYAAHAPSAESFADFVNDFFTSGGCGLNITAPYKQQALQVAAKATAFSRRADAVNVLRNTEEGISGCNTDGAGLLRDLQRNCGMAVAGQRILIVGAGGAARSAALALADNGAELTIAARREEAAETLATNAGCNFMPLSSCGGDYDIIINATSGGHDGEAPAIPASTFSTAQLAYDLNYGMAAVSFIRCASAARVRVDGVGMLVEQAALSFAVWESVMPSTAELVDVLRHRHQKLWE